MTVLNCFIYFDCVRNHNSSCYLPLISTLNSSGVIFVFTGAPTSVKISSSSLQRESSIWKWPRWAKSPFWLSLSMALSAVGMDSMGRPMSLKRISIVPKICKGNYIYQSKFLRYNLRKYKLHFIHILSIYIHASLWWLSWHTFIVISTALASRYNRPIPEQFIYTSLSFTLNNAIVAQRNNL